MLLRLIAFVASEAIPVVPTPLSSEETTPTTAVPCAGPCNSSISTSILDPGTHSVTLTATDRAGKSVNTSMTLVVEPEKVVEPPDGTEDGGDGDGNISDGGDGDGGVIPDPDGGDPTHEEDDKGFLGDSRNVAIVAVVVVVMAIMAVGAMLALRRKRQEVERLRKEEEEAGPALEGEVAALPKQPLKPTPMMMPKPAPVTEGGPGGEDMDAEWELSQEQGPSPVLKRESITKDPFSKKDREVVEADIREGED